MYLRTATSLPFILLTVVPTLITYFGWLDYNFFAQEIPPQTKHDGYDFVIVGGGSAGCVVSARLSENPLHQVLLIEAGGNPSPFSFVPLAVSYLQNHPTTDWQYKTVPQNNSAFASPNQSVTWPRGKGLGGSSTTNFMMYMRGNPKDFNEWETITGDSRWSYQNVQKYFKKMEDYRGFHKNINENHYGKDGPLRIEPIRYSPGLDNFLEAVTESGFTVRDLNADQQEGFSPIDYTQKRGRRFSAYSAYIKPILERKNLKVLKYSHVTKIHFDSDLRATGVSFIHQGRTEFISASKEVIISSGTINSAQLLMLSGIGPSDHLKSVGIEPLVELPVGRNLQDHVVTIIGPFTLNKSVSFMPSRDVSLGSLTDFALKGSGPLTSPMGTIAVGVTSTLSSPEWPNLFHAFASIGVYDALGATIDGVFGSGNYYAELLAPFIDYDAHTALLALGKPKSVGFIELHDANPFSKPIINPRYFSDEENQDMENMMEGYEMVLNLYENTTALGKKLGARLIELPECKSKFQVKTKSYYECAIRTLTFTLFHPVGTCSMGRVGDSKAVVDSQLRVIGTTGLRVIDASIMPTITNANTNAPTIMIGEVGADIIKQLYISHNQ